VVGIGGVGSVTAEMLTRCGIGTAEMLTRCGIGKVSNLQMIDFII